MATLPEIETLTKEYSAAYKVLSERVQNLNDEVEKVRRRLMAGIQSAAIELADHESVLRLSIDESPELFVRPRTVIFHGIKVGMAKGKGKIEWDDAEGVMKLIRKHLPDQYDTLVTVRETPNKGALESLDAGTLKKIGVRIEDCDDQVVIRPTDSEIDKAVRALLASFREENELTAKAA